MGLHEGHQTLSLASSAAVLQTMPPRHKHTWAQPSSTSPSTRALKLAGHTPPEAPYLRPHFQSPFCSRGKPAERNLCQTTSVRSSKLSEEAQRPGLPSPALCSLRDAAETLFTPNSTSPPGVVGTRCSRDSVALPLAAPNGNIPLSHLTWAQDAGPEVTSPRDSTAKKMGGNSPTTSTRRQEAR